MGWAVPPLPNTPSCRGDQLKHKDNFVFTFTHYIHSTLRDIMSLTVIEQFVNIKTYAQYSPEDQFRPNVFKRWSCLYAFLTEPRHDGVLGSGSVSPRILWPRHKIFRKHLMTTNSFLLPFVNTVFEIRQLMEGFDSYLYVMIFCILVTTHEQILIFSKCTYKPTSILATDRVILFPFMVFIFSANKLT
jgi:hypothetical protein